MTSLINERTAFQKFYYNWYDCSHDQSCWVTAGKAALWFASIVLVLPILILGGWALWDHCCNDSHNGGRKEQSISLQPNSLLPKVRNRQLRLRPVPPPVVVENHPSPQKLTKDNLLNSLFEAFPDLQNRQLNENQLMALGLYFHILPGPGKKHYSAIFESDLQVYIRMRWCDKTQLPDYKIRELIGKIEKIEITTSAEEMLRIFNTFGVIQLRPPMYDILVIGCGKNTGCAGGGHLEVDTVDQDMRRNPSVVAGWGFPQNDGYFARKKYHMIVDEGPISLFSAWLESNLNAFFTTCRLALQSDGLLVLPNEKPNEARQISMAALQNGFVKSSISSDCALGHTHYSCDVYQFPKLTLNG